MPQAPHKRIASIIWRPQIGNVIRTMASLLKNYFNVIWREEFLSFSLTLSPPTPWFWGSVVGAVESGQRDKWGSFISGERCLGDPCIVSQRHLIVEYINYFCLWQSVLTLMSLWSARSYSYRHVPAPLSMCAVLEFTLIPPFTVHFNVRD